MDSLSDCSKAIQSSLHKCGIQATIWQCVSDNGHQYLKIEIELPEAFKLIKGLQYSLFRIPFMRG